MKGSHLSSLQSIDASVDVDGVGAKYGQQSHVPWVGTGVGKDA
jgi:hypothetical protein